MISIVVITISNASNCKIIIKSCQNSITIINGILTYHFGYYSNIFNIKYNEKKENLKILIQYPDKLFIPDFSIKIESNEKHHIIINTYFVEKFSLETIEYLYDHNKALQNVISIQALKKRDLQSEEHMSQICSMALIKLLPKECKGLIDFLYHMHNIYYSFHDNKSMTEIYNNYKNALDYYESLNDWYLLCFSSKIISTNILEAIKMNMKSAIEMSKYNGQLDTHVFNTNRIENQWRLARSIAPVFSAFEYCHIHGKLVNKFYNTNRGFSIGSKYTQHYKVPQTKEINYNKKECEEYLYNFQQLEKIQDYSKKINEKIIWCKSIRNSYFKNSYTTDILSTKQFPKEVIPKIPKKVSYFEVQPFEPFNELHIHPKQNPIAPKQPNMPNVETKVKYPCPGCGGMRNFNKNCSNTPKLCQSCCKSKNNGNCAQLSHKNKEITL